LKPRAYYLLGCAYAQAGDPKQAATAYLRIPMVYQSESSALQSECLFQGAAVCEKAGLKEQSAALRRELAQRFPFSYRVKSK
jgi:TolA-binding protein